MLDPVTAIGLASSIVAFVDFGAKLVKGSIEIYKASDGTLIENRGSQAIAVAMGRFATRLLIQQPSQLSDEEKELSNLANECYRVCIKLIDLLELVKPKDMSSKRQSLWAALKSRFHESEREDLEKRLDTCRRQLELHMNFKNMISIGTLSEYVRHNSEGLKPLEATVSELLASGIDAQESIRQLLNIQRTALHVAINDRILESLDFEGMNARHGMIDEAYEKTFQWIFDVDSPDDDDDEIGSSFSADISDIVDSNDSGASMDFSRSEAQQKKDEEFQMRKESREKFLMWLSTGTGIFHISGKMGCGKSTLMKFLCQHPETHTRLDKWASGNSLIFANFFFWRSGSDLQKSLTGLYRSLLYTVLKLHPDFIPSVLPRVWTEARESSWRTQTKIHLRDDEISKAFTLLIGNTDLCANYYFCFFIDGLDEYQTKTQDDYMDLAKRLCSWTESFPSNVKLCVSSREENPFMTAFSPAQRLRLHTLTEFDIKAYISHRLPQSEDANNMRELQNSIVEKAGGIFFWVALVVRDIREQLQNGVEPAYLREIVSGLPDELDDLYRSMLKRLDKYSRKRAYQTFAMMPFVLGWHNIVRLDLLTYSFLNDYNRNHEFARGDILKKRLSNMEFEKQKRRENARISLNGWCRGLLEVHPSENIGYAHLSVADFLEAADIQAQIATSLNGIHPVSILSELVLARWKFLADDEDQRRGYNPYDIMHLRGEYHLDHAPFEFLRSMDAVFERDLERADDSTLNYSYIRIRAGVDPWHIVMRPRPHGRISQINVDLFFSPYFFPFLKTNEYVLWSIQNDPKTTDTTSKIVLLFYAAIYRPTYPVLDTLLRLDIITPEIRTHLMPDFSTMWRKVTYIMSEIGHRYSIWQYFLLQEFYAWLDNKTYNVKHRFVGIVERFLRRGANHEFRFSILVVWRPNRLGTKPVTEDTFTFGDPSETLSFRRQWRGPVGRELDNLDEIDDIDSLDNTFSKIRTWLCEPNGPRREISFTGWILAMGDFPGKENILQLIETRNNKQSSVCKE